MDSAHTFLSHYTGQDVLSKKLKKYSVSCCDITSKRRQGLVVTRSDTPRHTVVSFEGDASFDILTKPPSSCNTKKVMKRRLVSGAKRLRSGDITTSSNDDYDHPNAMMVSFWHSCPVTCNHVSLPVFKGKGRGPHMVVLRLIITITSVSVGTAIICDMSSIAQNASPVASINSAIQFQLQEEGFNYPYDGPVHNKVEKRRLELYTQLTSRLPLHHWPEDSPFYQGLGERHRDPRGDYHPQKNGEGYNIDVGFPYNMLHLQPCVELGNGHLEIIARYSIPRGTCFGYCGATFGANQQISSHQRKSNSTENYTSEIGTTGDINGFTISTPTSDQDDVDIYSFQLNKANTVVGSGITRYINHRYNFSKFGNVQFGTIVIPVSTNDPMTPTTSLSSSQKNKKSNTHNVQARNYLSIDENGMLTLPFFISTTDIARGEKVLATSYGDAYDAELERAVRSSFSYPGESTHSIYSLRNTIKSTSRSNIFPSSDYTQAIVPNESFVVVNHMNDAVTTPIFQVHDVCNIGSGTMLLLTPMHRIPSANLEAYAVARGEMQHFIGESEGVGLLYPDDFILYENHLRDEGKEDSKYQSHIALTKKGSKEVENYIQNSPKETFLDQIHWPLLSVGLP